MHWENYLPETIAALNAVDPVSLHALARSLYTAWKGGHAIYTCGNGGSGANASHLAQDLNKGTIVGGFPRLRAFCLCDSVSSLLAWGNDSGFEFVFSEQLRSLGQPSDVLIAISGSGNSENVLKAVQMAHCLRMRTWGVTGFDGGKLINLAHRAVHVKCNNMGMAEAVHGVIFHWLVERLRSARSGELSIKDESDWLGVRV